MSNKNLLNEAQVRKFMKLASLQPLSSGFVTGLTERGSKSGDEGSVAAGKKGDTDYSGEGEREGDESETHEGEDLEESHVEESHGRGKWESAAGPRDGAGSQNARNEALDDADEELEFATDDLEGGSPVEDEEAAVDLDVAAEEEGAMEPEGEGPMVDVAQFMTLLKTALETAVSEITGEPTEVEVADDVVDVEDEAEADVGGAEAMEMDVDMSAEEEVPLEEKATNELVERITKRVAARILKSALAKK